MQSQTAAVAGHGKLAQLRLTGEFQLYVAGERLSVPHSVERVLAYLALSDRPVARTKLAETLWIDGPESRAVRNLRTALWRLHRIDDRLIAYIEDRLALVPDVAVDLARLRALIRRLIEGGDEQALRDVSELVWCAELLPDWDDEWVIADRERFRLLRLEALERAAETLLARGDLSRALEAALGSAVSEPLRESARRLIVEVQIAEGNRAEALQGYDQYRALLRTELGIEPSPALEALVSGLLSTRRRHDR
jgi:DNA-binding SARP family transcriptional activator